MAFFELDLEIDLASQPHSLEPSQTTFTQETTQQSTQSTLATQSIPSTQASSTANRVQWTEKLELALLHHLRNEIILGRRVESSFKAQTWQDAVAVIKKALPSGYTGPSFTAQIIKNRWEFMKKDYDAFMLLKNASGLGWDDSLQKVTCSEAVWKAFVEKHKDCRKFRKKDLKYYELIMELQEGTFANGEFADANDVKRQDTPAQSVPVSPTPGPSSEPAAIKSESLEKREPFNKRKSARKVKEEASARALQAKIDLAQSIRMLAEVGQKMITEEASIQERALARLRNEFPDLDGLDFIAVCDLFEQDAKAQIYNSLPNINTAKQWLMRELKKLNHITLSQAFNCASMSTSESTATPTSVTTSASTTTSTTTLMTTSTTISNSTSSAKRKFHSTTTSESSKRKLTVSGMNEMSFDTVVIESGDKEEDSDAELPWGPETDSDSEDIDAEVDNQKD